MPANPSSRSPQPATSRDALLDAALSLVRRQGWSATSVNDLCRAAGVTKGTFFHYFESKEALGVAAARRWGDFTGALFRVADYHHIADPLDRIFGYLDLRGQLADGPLEAITCFAGTTIQETFATSEPIRAACGKTIDDHIVVLAHDLRAAIDRYPPREPVTAEDLALHIQTVLQGAFVMAKARNSNAPVHAALAHLKRYLAQLFDRPIPAGSSPTQE